MVKKPDKRCIPLHIPEQRFLSDPSHRIRILLRPAFLKSNGPVYVEAATFQSRLSPTKNKLWSVDKRNRNLSLTEFMESSKAPINHLFGCHAQLLLCTTNALSHGVLQSLEKVLVTENIMTRKRKRKNANG